MGLFQNEAIRSLPEQVEKNKEDIKNILDILENIDPDQVATILSDIASLQAEQVTQNLAIGSNASNIANNTTAINNEKTAREDVVGVNVAGNTYLKTATANKQILIYNNGHIGLTSYNTNIDITAPSDYVRIATDNSSVQADEVNGVIISVDGDNPKTLTLKPNGDFEVSNGHILKFDNTGAITIDGQPIGGGGGGSQLYQHNVNITIATYNVCFSFISQSSTPITTKNEIRDFLVNSGLNSATKLLSATGYHQGGGPIFGIYSSGSSNLTLYTFNVGSSSFDPQNVYGLVMTINDVVITL